MQGRKRSKEQNSSDGKKVRTWVGTLRTVIALQKRAAMQGAQSAKPIGASGHEPRQKAEYMTAPDFMPKPLRKSLQRGGRPYMTRIPSVVSDCHRRAAKNARISSAASLSRMPP